MSLICNCPHSRPGFQSGEPYKISFLVKMERLVSKQTYTAEQKRQAQADEYSFPYHYIPQPFGKLWLSRHWGFAPSYVAALEIFLSQIAEEQAQAGKDFSHLDIGCGDGALLHYFTKANGLLHGKLSGVDMDARSIEWARMFTPTVDFRAEDLSEIEEQYRSASLIEVAEHIPVETLPKFLAATAARLEDGGKLFLTVPSVEKPIFDKHFQHFSFDSLRTVLEPKFEKIEIFGFERTSRAVRLIQRLRNNSRIRVDAPRLNRMLVDSLSALHREQAKCGRLFAVATKRSDP